MEQQQTGGSGTGEPSLTEEVQAQPDANDASGAEAPALNRADRRAQAKGKKSGTGPNTNLNAGGARGSGKPTSGHAGQVRFPRTGHK